MPSGRQAKALWDARLAGIPKSPWRHSNWSPARAGELSPVTWDSLETCSQPGHRQGNGTQRGRSAAQQDQHILDEQEVVPFPIPHPCQMSSLLVIGAVAHLLACSRILRMLTHGWSGHIMEKPGMLPQAQQLKGFSSPDVFTAVSFPLQVERIPLPFPRGVLPELSASPLISSGLSELSA